ncbi:hypothetical protein H6F89_27945 [Cyanobacteria bacterium FACHB-63]|nr:hypothetical protein [Cyanobacteria bacterium FACHB-63]
MSNPQPKPKEDEPLGVEQLPQDELSASPGDEEIQASYLDVEAAGAATTSADSTEQQESENQPSQAVE